MVKTLKWLRVLPFLLEGRFNRLINLTISKASKWSLTLTQDWTNAYDEFIPEDPYFNPLEAIIYGDIGYFLGKRNNVNPPSWAVSYTHLTLPTNREV